MQDAEIGASGTVLVEGHHVGELQGFRFTADASAGGEDAKAVKAAAQKALSTEFEARAERFAASGNSDMALASDGTLRWIGAPIGTLAAGEDVLKPRVILLADEQLTGPARDKVAARAERFVNFQIESLLKPLVDLKNAEQLAGIARGIAFRLVEQLGLVNRRDIADDMRALDQEGRAALRRLGVRFGAYHVFVPSLVKPAPAGLITLLWALQNDGKDKMGFGDIVHALASGRTSMVVNQSFDKEFYRLAGYRNLGRRAVRVDILERLADLIRPATNWKPGLGPRPDGAYDGHAFTVTPAMLSILGATPDDMEEILKGLGYRAESKPAEEVKARLDEIDAAVLAAAEAKAAEAAATKAAEASTDGSADSPKTEAVAEAPNARSDSEEPKPQMAEEVSTEVPDASSAEQAEASDQASNANDENNGTDETTPAEATPQAETEEPEPPKPVLLWRQQRFDRPRQRHDHRRHDGTQHGHAGKRRDGEKPGKKGRGRRPQDADRHDGRPGGNGKPGEGHGGNRKGGNPAFQHRPREEKPARFDPDSPFAKLAALRDQLKK